MGFLTRRYEDEQPKCIQDTWRLWIE